MRYPAPLADGGTIGIVAPAFGATTEPYFSALAKAEKRWRSWGYAVREWPCVRRDDGAGISSSPARCAAELVDAWCCPDVDVLLSCGGGELMCETMGHADLARIAAAEPKWFMGYSDNTNLTFALATVADVASVYGPCAPAFGMREWHPALGDAFDVLRGRDPLGVDATAPTVGGYGAWQLESDKDEEHPLEPYNCTEAPCVEAWLPAGVDGATVDGLPAEKCWRMAAADEVVAMRGRLLGGCLDVLAGLVGTPLDGTRGFNERYADDGVVWFLEACDLGPIAYRRALWQLAHAGWFDRAAGIMVGRPMRWGCEEMGMTFADATLAALADAGVRVPVLLDCDFGHLPPQMPLVCGSLADVECSPAGAADGAAARSVSVRMGLVP